MNIDNKEITTSTKRRSRRIKIKEKNKVNKLNEIKQKIEDDAEKKVIELNKTIKSFNDFKKPEIGNFLLNIMQTGADEFKEKTGRNMTYSEMRYMFG
jgi:hypothetical protein